MTDNVRSTTIDLRNKFGRIGILMGGPSTEHDISLKSGTAVLNALRDLDFDVVPITIETDDIEKNTALIRSQQLSCAFIALHGRFGEDGVIQSILETVGIPYTGSGVEASKKAIDKALTHAAFEKNGIRAPRYQVLCKGTVSGFSSPFGWPLVIKPATHGSSIGLSIIEHERSLPAALALAFSFDEKIIVEEYIKGRELTVAILDDKPLPVIEIIPKEKFYDFEAKYKSGATEYVVPAKLPDVITAQVQQVALAAHKAVGCIGCSRVDVMLRCDDVPFALEVNTIPGLTATSLLPKAARAVGIDFADLCLKLISLAYEKT